MPGPAGRERLDRQVQESHQRDRVLLAAIEVFARRGYPATTVDHLVAAARIGVSSFYALFDGKEDCFLTAYDRVIASARERIVSSLPAGASQPQKVCAAMRALLALIAEEPLGARIALVEAQTAGPAAIERYRATMEGLAAELRRCRSESAAAGELPASFEVSTLGGVAWFLQQRIVRGEIGEAPELLPDLAEIVLEPYVGHEATARLLAEAS